MIPGLDGSTTQLYHAGRSPARRRGHGKGDIVMAAEWPSRFVYICSAGRAALVHALPLVHAGLDRVARMIVFCGAIGPDETDSNDRAEAILPAFRFRDIVSRLTDGRISEANGTLIVLYGEPATVADWRSNMRQALDTLSREPDANLPVLFNIKCGTKEMAIGGAIALAAGAIGRGQLITVSDRLPRVERVTGNGQEPLPVAGGHLDLPRYLELYGYHEHVDRGRSRTHQQRAVFEALCASERERIQAFAARLMPRAPTLWPLLASMAWQSPDETHLESAAVPTLSPGETDANRIALALALGALHGFPGLDVDLDAAGRCTSFRATSAMAVRFLTGGWLEAHIYLVLRETLRDRNDILVAASLGLAATESPNIRDTEIDVAVMIGSQLLIVEAKSSTMTGKAAERAGERSLPAAESNMRALLGQVGKMLIVNPCVEAKTLKQGGSVIPKTRRAGMDLFVGPEAVAELADYLRALAAGDAPGLPVDSEPAQMPQ